MNYDVKMDNGVSSVCLKGSLSNDMIDEIKDVLTAAISDSDSGLVVNLVDVSFLCSAAFGMFFSLHTFALRSNKKICFCCVQKDIEKLFTITGVQRYMNIVKSHDEALSFLHQ
ncbi:MAG: STAS domain-containing protein [Spirochaetes bacterium]|nr:STAS domain-containing protein [Spirochaetota bacterium]